MSKNQHIGDTLGVGATAKCNIFNSEISFYEQHLPRKEYVSILNRLKAIYTVDHKNVPLDIRSQL